MKYTTGEDVKIGDTVRSIHCWPDPDKPGHSLSAVLDHKVIGFWKNELGCDCLATALLYVSPLTAGIESPPPPIALTHISYSVCDVEFVELVKGNPVPLHESHPDYVAAAAG